MNSLKDVDFLIQLLDDPEADVFDQVKLKFLELGKDAYPYLVSESETNANPLVQERLRSLMQQIESDQSLAEFAAWAQNEDAQLIDGMVILAKANNRYLDPYLLYGEIAQMKKNIWLEYNEYLTPLEQLNIFINILYNFYNIKHTAQQDTPPHSKFHFLDNIFNLKMGSTTAIDVLYLILFQKFEIPVVSYLLPNGNTILAYKDGTAEEKHQGILCFLFSSYGEILSYTDIYHNLKSINPNFKLELIQPLTNKQLLKNLLLQIVTDLKRENNTEQAELFQQFYHLLEE